MFRYPGDPVEPTINEASEVLLRARYAVEEIAARISLLVGDAAHSPLEG
jgi:hypothetical protein